LITGTCALHRAIDVIAVANGRIRRIKRWASTGDIGEISAAINPTTVIGATNGAAQIFAMIENGDIYPESATIMGRQKAKAAIGGAKSDAIFDGNHRDKYVVIMGAMRSNPNVASTDKAKPGSRACHGSIEITVAMAKPNAGSESLRR